MKIYSSLIFSALILAQVGVAAVPVVMPEDVGLSAERLARVTRLVERLQSEGKMAGAVTVVARRGKVAQFEVRGLADLESKRAMRTDDIFAIASMTKPIATVAVLMLLEEQRLLLSDPLEKFLPEFRAMKVATPNAASANGYDLVPVQRSITIHDLLTHRAGFPGQGGPGGVRPVTALRREAMRSLPAEAGLAEHVAKLATAPLDNQPGAEWRYGDSVLVLGRVIEVVSGKPLDVYLREKIFEPLDMTDTAFNVSPEKLGRLAPIYSYSAEKGLAKSRGPATSPQLLSASGGLFSTAPDYLRFCQMLLNGGELEGRRLLSRKSVELMGALHVDQIPLSFLDGQGFGLGVAVLKAGGASGLLGSAGTYGWSGAYNTYFRIDPQDKMIVLLFTQLSPANNLDLQYGFHNAAMQAIAD